MKTTDWGTPPALIPTPQAEGDAPGEPPSPDWLVKSGALPPENKPKMRTSEMADPASDWSRWDISHWPLDSGELIVHLDSKSVLTRLSCGAGPAAATQTAGHPGALLGTISPLSTISELQLLTASAPDQSNPSLCPQRMMEVVLMAGHQGRESLSEEIPHQVGL